MGKQQPLKQKDRGDYFARRETLVGRVLIFLILFYATFQIAGISLTLLFGTSKDTATLTTAIFLGILFSTARLLGRVLFPREVNLIAATLVLRIRRAFLGTIKPCFISLPSSLHKHKETLALRARMLFVRAIKPRFTSLPSSLHKHKETLALRARMLFVEAIKPRFTSLPSSLHKHKETLAIRARMLLVGAIKPCFISLPSSLHKHKETLAIRARMLFVRAIKPRFTSLPSSLHKHKETLALRARMLFVGAIKQRFTSALSHLHPHRAAIVLLLFLLAFHGITNYVVIRQDNVFFHDSSAYTYRDAAKLSNEGFRQFLSAPWRLIMWYGVGTQYPIIFPGVSALFLSLFGFTQDTAVMSNLVWLTILLPSIYAIALKLFNKRTALFSILLVSFFPGIVAASRGYMRELPLTAMVTISLALLLYSEGMRRRLPSILFGFTVSLAALTYPTFILFLAGPFLLEVVFPLIRNYRRHSLMATKVPLVNILIAATIVLLLVSPWYFKYIILITEHYWMRADGSIAPQSGFPWLLAGLRYQLTPTLLILAVCAFIIFRNSKAVPLLLWWALPAMMVLSMIGYIPFFIPRYILPAIPAFAIPLGRLGDALRGYVNSNVQHKIRFPPIGLSFALLLGILLILHATFWQYRDLLGPLEGWTTNPLGAHMVKRVSPEHLSFGYRISPVQIEADIESAVVSLTEELGARNSPAELWVLNPLGIFTEMVTSELEVRLTTWERFNTEGSDFSYNLERCINVSGGSGPKEQPFPWNDRKGCMELLISADYLIIEDMNALPLGTAKNETFTYIIDYIQENLDSFQILAELPKEEIAHFYYDDMQTNNEYFIPDFIKGRVLILKAKK